MYHVMAELISLYVGILEVAPIPVRWRFNDLSTLELYVLQ
jgi:hypothetical protein